MTGVKLASLSYYSYSREAENFDRQHEWQRMSDYNTSLLDIAILLKCNLRHLYLVTMAHLGLIICNSHMTVAHLV